MPNIFHSIFRWLRTPLNAWNRVFFKSRTVKKTSETALTGVPLRPRTKTYSGATGFVYQYLYKGQQSGVEGILFVFSVTNDRKTWVTVRVLIDSFVIQQLEQSDGRIFSTTERYAIAKLTLFEFFDQAETLEVSALLRPDVDDVKGKLTELGII